MSRNNCFSHRSGCFHDPKRMKEKKANLDANGIPIFQVPEIAQVAYASAVGQGREDWSMQNSDEGDDDHSLAGHEVLPDH